MQEELGYTREFIEEVVGSWEGEPLERPEQLPFEVREEIQWPILNNPKSHLPKSDRIIAHR